MTNGQAGEILSFWPPSATRSHLLYLDAAWPFNWRVCASGAWVFMAPGQGMEDGLMGQPKPCQTHGQMLFPFPPEFLFVN